MLKSLRSECLIELEIVTRGPMLIKAGHLDARGVALPAVKTERNGRSEAYIPGSTLKGLIRAQAERIARTLSDPGCCDPFLSIDNHQRAQGASCSSYLTNCKQITSHDIYQRSCPVCKLFGNTCLASRLAFQDAYLVKPLTHLPVRHNVGIDRHTGGVSSGPFDMEVTPPETAFGTTLYLRNFELWQLGLLAFVLRDFEDGTLKIGMGKSRGLGQIKATVNGLDIRYLGLNPPPVPGELCKLRGLRSLAPDNAYGFAAYGTSTAARIATNAEAGELHLYDHDAPQDAVRAASDGFGLRTIYHFEPSQLSLLWHKVAPFWVTYARENLYITETVG